VIEVGRRHLGRWSGKSVWDLVHQVGAVYRDQDPDSDSSPQTI